MIVDVSGYVPTGSGVAALVPARLSDTRPAASTSDGVGAGTGLLGGGSTLEITVGGRGGVPADASSAMLNVTAVTPFGSGFLTVYPCGASRPNASNVNYVTGDVVANAVFAKLGTNGKVCVYSSAPTDVIVDVSGYVPTGS